MFINDIFKKKLNESLRDGEYYTFRVFFNDGTNETLNFGSDDIDWDQVGARRGKQVVDVKRLGGIQGSQTDTPKRPHQYPDDSFAKAQRAYDRQLPEGVAEGAGRSFLEIVDDFLVDYSGTQSGDSYTWSNSEKVIEVEMDPADPGAVYWALGIAGRTGKTNWVESGSDNARDALRVVKNFAKNALPEGVAEGYKEISEDTIRPKLAAALKEIGFKGPFKLSQLPKWMKKLQDSMFGEDTSIMIGGDDPQYDPWVAKGYDYGYSYGIESGYQSGLSAQDVFKRAKQDLMVQDVAEGFAELDAYMKAQRAPKPRGSSGVKQGVYGTPERKRGRGRGPTGGSGSAVPSNRDFGRPRSIPRAAPMGIDDYDANHRRDVDEGSVQDKLHKRHQELRKKSGLPDPDYYKELKASYNIENDQERLSKQAEIKKKYRVEEGLNEFVDDDGKYSGRPDIRVKYLQGEDFAVSVNGHQYSLTVKDMEGKWKDPRMYSLPYDELYLPRDQARGQAGVFREKYRDPNLWRWSISDGTLLDINGYEPDQQTYTAVGEYIDQHHQADLVRVAIFQANRRKKHPNYNQAQSGVKTMSVADFVRDAKQKERNKDQGVAEGINVVDANYDLDQMVLTLDIEGKKQYFTYWDYDENFDNAERKDVFDQLQEQPWYTGLDHPTKMEILDAAYRAIRGEEPSEYRPTVGDEPLDEAGPFSYGAKKPRKGSVADLAAKKRKEQEKNYKPIEPRDQMVGIAKVTTNEDVEKYLEEMRRAGYDIVTEAATMCPECGGAAYSDQMLAEKQDACYSKVKSRYKVWPSAYASGALVRCRKVGAKNWGNKSKK